jgi:hypothetical protein
VAQYRKFLGDYMANNPQRPASLVTTGPVSFYLPTAQPVLDDEGNVVNPGTDALELQREQMKRAEENVELAAQGDDDLLKQARVVADQEKKPLREVYEELKKRQDDDAKFLEEHAAKQAEEAKKAHEEGKSVVKTGQPKVAKQAAQGPEGKEAEKTGKQVDPPKPPSLEDQKRSAAEKEATK